MHVFRDYETLKEHEDQFNISILLINMPGIFSNFGLVGHLSIAKRRFSLTAILAWINIMDNASGNQIF